MNAMRRIDRALSVAVEQSLTSAINEFDNPTCPPQLAAAVRHAVFPGGARVRPRLCLSVALACGEDDTAVADAAAAAIELLHCASLVHDDLPCFDDAPIRRGKPSVHAAFGERLAVLSGDALIVMAFQVLARGAAASPHRLSQLLMIITRAVGMPTGIVAGQAWECESRVVLENYHLAKTGELFAAASMAGAASAGVDPGPWRVLGERLGEAYQVADDIQDVIRDSKDSGKPQGRDAALGRPSAVAELGLAGATQRLRNLVKGAVDAVPACDHADQLRALILDEAQRFLPKDFSLSAA